MSYITPVTNRTAADIAARNSKAFMNAIDWDRIHNNAKLVNSLTAIMLEDWILFEPYTFTSYFISVADVNKALANIERLRLTMAGIFPNLAEVKDDWVAGPNQLAPNYQHVNQWESTLDSIWVYWGGPSLPVSPILSSNLTINTGNQAIYVDYLDTANFNIDLQGTARLYII
jgi:hypothetical protein